MKKKKKIVVPATLEYLPIIRTFIKISGITNKYPNKVINAVKLAVEESCTNIIRHGYPADHQGDITIEILAHDNDMTVIIIDQGKTFNPLHVAKPNLREYVERRKIGGLGILMIRRLMDEKYYTVTSRGNELTLIKYCHRVFRSRYKKMWHTIQQPLRKFIIPFRSS